VQPKNVSLPTDAKLQQLGFNRPPSTATAENCAFRAHGGRDTENPRRIVISDQKRGRPQAHVDRARDRP
jgi:hypothetical protein